MSPELERALVEKYPDLFAGFRVSIMPFGFECGDGWFDLIDSLCSRLVALDPGATAGEVEPLRARQVKEKFGSLCFYIGPATREAHAMIGLAGDFSAKICETCGNRGRLRRTPWIKTLCDACAEKEGRGK